jgi:hypothetical protein
MAGLAGFACESMTSGCIALPHLGGEGRCGFQTRRLPQSLIRSSQPRRLASLAGSTIPNTGSEFVTA